MPIINHSQAESEEREPPRGILPPGRGPVPPASPDHRNAEPRPTSFKWGWAMLAVAVLLAGGVAAFKLDSPAAVPGSADVGFSAADTEGLNLQIDRLVRIAGLADLTSKKIEQNRNALESAASRQDDVIADTMKLALARNLKDLKEYRAAQVSQLTELHAYYLQDPKRVEEQFRARLKISDDMFKLGNAEVIQQSLTLLAAVPEGTDAATIFNEQLDGE